MWERDGECNHCGSCCRGCVLHDNKAMRCKDRQSDIYLSGCNVFPTHPRQVTANPGCSYSFRWIEDVPNPYSWEGWKDEFEMLKGCIKVRLVTKLPDVGG